MKRLPVVLLIVAAATFVAGCGGNSSKSDQVSFVSAKGCSGKKPNKVNDRTIVRVNGNSCVVADKGALVIARGYATVAAHGDSTVDAGDHVTVVVYNFDVTCNIRGVGVTVVNAVKSDFGKGVMGPTCY